MARINTNVPSIIARANLANSNKELELRLHRLSTGLAINRGADDPAGLITSERLRSEISGLNKAVTNSDRASAVIATTESALSEIGDLLNSIKGLVVEAANTGGISSEERAANQLQIDSAIDTITRISNSASFAGLKLLNGELSYVLSGLAAASISKATIYGANFAGQSNIQVKVTTTASAQLGSLFLRGDYSSTPAANGTFLSAATIEVAGTLGVQTFQFPAGTALSSVVYSINTFKQATGVSAAQINASVQSSGIVFNSTTYGSNAFVSVKRTDTPGAGTSFFTTYQFASNASRPATFSFANGAITSLLTAANRDTGRDVSALVNGQLSTGTGINLSLQNASTLSAEFLLSNTFATTQNSTTTFHITGGGALYQLGGTVNISQQANLGIPSAAASRLGGTLLGGQLHFLDSIKSGGANDLRSRRFENASGVLQTSIDEISVIRGRLGAFERNTLQTNVRSLQSAVENLTASESQIRDADFAKETSALTRAQVLSSAGTSVLALSNQQSQQVLQLLQR